MVVGMESRVEEGRKSGVDKCSMGSPSSQRCSCSMLLSTHGSFITREENTLSCSKKYHFKPNLMV